MQRTVALRADGGGERMVVGLGVVADHLDLLLDEPIAGRRHEAGRAAEIVLAVLVELVPAGVDDHHVARPHDLAGGLFEVVVGDRLPFLLRDRHHDAGAEEMRQRHLVDERRALDDVRRRVDVRGVVHGGRDALRQHARLRHVVDALDLDVLEIGPVRRLIAEAMGQVVELQPHAVLEVLFERHAANFLGHGILLFSAFTRDLRMLFRRRPRRVSLAQAAAAFICVSMARLVASSRSAMSACRFWKRWVGTGTEIATALPSGSCNATPAAQMPSVCSSRSKATPVCGARLEVGEQGFEAGQRLRRARLVGAADQRLDRRIVELRRDRPCRWRCSRAERSRRPPTPCAAAASRSPGR